MTDTAGSMNERITLEYIARTSDGMGGFNETWTEDSTVWCEIKDTAAREMIQAMATTMVVSHRIRIRYKSDVTNAWRVKYMLEGTAKYFAIVGIQNQRRGNEFMWLLCKEASVG